MPMRPKPLALAGALTVMLLSTALGVAPAAADDRVVIVQPGQTLGQIAEAHGLSIERLVQLNHLADPNRIYVGQRLRLSPPRHAARNGMAARRLVSHRVVAGETLSGIAARYHLDVEKLVRRNRLPDASRIYVGQVLRIRMVPIRHHRGGKATSSRDAASHVTHVVRFGETLSGIALRYHVALGRLAAVNGIRNPSFITVGQMVTVPVRHGSSPRATQPGRSSHSIGWAMPADMAALVSRRMSIGRIIRAEARARGVPPALAMAVAWQESGWQEHVRSSAGAIGVMQLLPSTADWVAATMLGRSVNLWNARSNVRAGVTLLKHYLRHYNGNRHLALAAYYQGQAGTDRHGIYPISRPYVDSILILERLFGGR